MNFSACCRSPIIQSKGMFSDEIVRDGPENLNMWRNPINGSTDSVDHISKYRV